MWCLQVEVQDGTAGDPSQLTTYNYIGNPAWHYDDNEVVKAKDRTWGQFRGFAQVESLAGNPANVTNGVADAQTLTETRYFLGMNGDTNSSRRDHGGVTVTDSLGTTYPDTNALAGQALETQTFNGATGAEITAKITDPAVRGDHGGAGRGPGCRPSGHDGRDHQGARLHRPGRRHARSRRRRPRPMTATAGRCWSISLARHSRDLHPDHLRRQHRPPGSGTPSARSSSRAQACPARQETLTAADIVTDTRTYYDGATSLTAAPTAGNPTMTNAATANNAGTLTFVTQSTRPTTRPAGSSSATDGPATPPRRLTPRPTAGR